MSTVMGRQKDENRNNELTTTDRGVQTDKNRNKQVGLQTIHLGIAQTKKSLEISDSP